MYAAAAALNMLDSFVVWPAISDQCGGLAACVKSPGLVAYIRRLSITWATTTAALRDKPALQCTCIYLISKLDRKHEVPSL